MSNDERKKILEYMEADFIPIGSASAENKIANALEYAAFHLGRIDKRLEKITGLLHASNIARR